MSIDMCRPSTCRPKQKAVEDFCFAVTLVTSTLLAFGQAPASQPPSTASPVRAENATSKATSVEASLPAANPARPTFTIPASLPPVGYLQFEQGFVRAGASLGMVAGQSALAQVTKIALTPRLLFQSLAQPYAYSSLSDAQGALRHSNDPGDLLLGVQGVLYTGVGRKPTFSTGYIRRVRGGTSASLDSGSYSQSALVLVGGDVRGGFHYDANFLVNEQNNGPARRAQFAQTLAVTHALFPATTKKRLSSIAELSHFTQPLIHADRTGSFVSRANAIDLLLAGTWAVRPNLILDTFIVRGFTSTSTSWQGGFGVSYLVPHRLLSR